jgi:hypothetical protein
MARFDTKIEPSKRISRLADPDAGSKQLNVEGELRASTVVIAEGAQMEGEVSAEELTIGGYVKGTIHANRVKLDSTAVVEGDSRECRDDWKMPWIRRRASKRTAHNHRPGRSAATARPAATLKPTVHPALPICEPTDWWHITAWVIKRKFMRVKRCPLYPQKRTSLSTIAVSALCQKQTFCAAAKTSLFDHLVGAHQKR